MADLLITGGAGFIGTNFVRWWRKANPRGQVVVLDALTYAGHRANLDGIPEISFVHGDIRDFNLVRKLLTDHRLDTIVHFAAESHVDRSIDAPDAFIETNVNGTHALLKAAKAVWLDQGGGRHHRFHHVSTDEVYGSLAPDAPAFHEETPYAPNSPYSASKAASDHLVRAYHHTFGLLTTISNCSNNYGPYQFPEKLIPLFIINALSGRSLPVYGDGMNVRDWLHVEDHCRAIGAILSDGQVGETYNIGGRTELPNQQVVAHICDRVDAAFRAESRLAKRYPRAPAARGERTASLITSVTDRAGHDRRYAMNTGKIEKVLDFKWNFDFNRGMAATLQWYLENEEWWRDRAELARPGHRA